MKVLLGICAALLLVTVEGILLPREYCEYTECEPLDRACVPLRHTNPYECCPVCGTQDDVTARTLQVSQTCPCGGIDRCAEGLQCVRCFRADMEGTCQTDDRSSGVYYSIYQQIQGYWGQLTDWASATYDDVIAKAPGWWESASTRVSDWLDTASTKVSDWSTSVSDWVSSWW
ncbi:hypothetical protein Bbelb_096700 [Branchiostoma belcheri]|nr:hypothetical protein Bbelb_096700 [Branchiostoma belcheri]